MELFLLAAFAALAIIVIIGNIIHYCICSPRRMAPEIFDSNNTRLVRVYHTPVMMANAQSQLISQPFYGLAHNFPGIHSPSQPPSYKSSNARSDMPPPYPGLEQAGVFPTSPFNAYLQMSSGGNSGPPSLNIIKPR